MEREEKNLIAVYIIIILGFTIGMLSGGHFSLYGLN